MKYNERISTPMKSLIKTCTTVDQRKEVAKQNNISIHTLNSIIEGKRKITDFNQKSLIDLLRVSIANAKSMSMSLTKYWKEYDKND